MGFANAALASYFSTCISKSEVFKFFHNSFPWNSFVTLVFFIVNTWKLFDTTIMTQPTRIFVPYHIHSYKSTTNEYNIIEFWCQQFIRKWFQQWLLKVKIKCSKYIKKSLYFLAFIWAPKICLNFRRSFHCSAYGAIMFKHHAST